MSIDLDNHQLWAVIAEWTNSGPTVHGPFHNSRNAEDWADQYWMFRSPECVAFNVYMLDAPE